MDSTSTQTNRASDAPEHAEGAAGTESTKPWAVVADAITAEWPSIMEARLRSALGDPPRYGACDYARAVIGKTERPWHDIGTVALQYYRNGKSYVYFVGGETGLVKIGLSIAPLERITTLQMGSPIDLRFLALVEGGLTLEREYHAKFAGHRVRGEWFARVPEIEAEIARLRA